MPVTDDDRSYCIERATVALAGARWLQEFRYAEDISDFEALRRGFMCECAFANALHLPRPPIVLNPRGDHGTDFLLWLMTKGGAARKVLNVKAKTVRKSWPALRDYGTTLNVPERYMTGSTIYVFGIYLLPTDDADVLTYATGDEILAENAVEIFTRTRGIVRTHTLPFDKTHQLQGLQNRMLEHYCETCRTPTGMFGINGHWFCSSHRPATAQRVDAVAKPAAVVAATRSANLQPKQFELFVEMPDVRLDH